MMQTKKYFILLLSYVLSLMSGCQKKDVNKITNNKDFAVIKINMDQKKEIPSQDWFASLEIVKLETKEESLMYDNYNFKMYYYQDKYFILDRDQNAIFVFDKDGKFLLSSKDKEGEGPGEYFHLLDFDINYENQTIEIIDVSAYKIRRYTTDFTFLNEINLPLDVYPISSFELLSPDLYCFYESANGTKEVNILKMYSAKKNKIVGEFLPVLKDNRPTTQQNSFYNFEGQIFYTFPFPNNELYRIDISDHSISKVLEYDLGKYNLPYDAFISSHVPGYEYFEEYKDYLFITHKYENSKYYLGFIQKHNDLYAFKYNKATKEMDIISRIFSDGGILLPPALVDEECLYVLTSPQYLDITINPDLLDEKSKDVYRSLQEDDNPVILKYYLK